MSLVKLHPYWETASNPFVHPEDMMSIRTAYTIGETAAMLFTMAGLSEWLYLDLGRQASIPLIR